MNARGAILSEPDDRDALHNKRIETPGILLGQLFRQNWKKMLSEGNNITLYDFDGPRTEDGDVMCLEVTEDLLREKIGYLKHPFGHGYVVAAYFKDIEPNEYIG
jgi:hypothetical protein